MYLPTLETFNRYIDQGNMVPVFRELPGDLDTPVSLFLKLKGEGPSFLLESVEKGEHLGRYSFIGTNPSLILQASGSECILRQNGEGSRVRLGTAGGGPDPLHLIQKLLAERHVIRIPGLPRFFGGAVGYLAYDMVRFFEKLPACPHDQLLLPDCLFMFTDTMVIFDHVQRKIKVVSNTSGDKNNKAAYREAVDKIEAIIDVLSTPLSADEQRSGLRSREGKAPDMTSNFSAQRFEDMVRGAKDYILAGDIFQAVVSQRLSRQTIAEPFNIYRSLRQLNPSPYMFYLDFRDFQLIGSSPEMLVKLEEGKAETRPIAGTRPRGSSDEEDEILAAHLLDDPKERAEHVMLVDLGRNDLGRVCRHGSVRVPLYMGIEKYSHVIHIVSAVEGMLDEGHDAFSLLRACFPAGTVSGAPKIRAMEIINELEGLRRGPYAGAVGYFSYSGNMDTCITIRTIVMVKDTVYLQGGAGIVADSEPHREYQESLKKIEALEKAVILAEGYRV